jgi:hypothetical protein
MSKCSTCVRQMQDAVPWSSVQKEIYHHVFELRRPRKLAHSTRVQALCGVYIYLRDGAAANWYAPELQNQRNREFYSMASNSGVGTGGSSICKKCGTALHGGGFNNCPWKLYIDKLARKAGADALNNLSRSLPPVPPEE